MALDEPDNQDMTEVIGEITFCMAKDLYDRIGAVTIDLGYMGFQILTERPYQDASAGGCSSGGCSGSCSGGSCSI